MEPKPKAFKKIQILKREEIDNGNNAEVNNTHKKIDEDIPPFDPERALRLREEVNQAKIHQSQSKLNEKNEAELGKKEDVNLVEQFKVDPKEYPIFSTQGGIRDDEINGGMHEVTLGINETLGLMVGATAETISIINGEDKKHPKADHVIYLDKSARPVSWLVDEFWNDFSNNEQPSKSYLAIDRRPWFERVGLDITANQYNNQDGKSGVATGRDFWEKYEELSDEQKLEWSAKIRALYIDGGIDNMVPNEIMKKPTILDGKNLLVIDEVSRSGATLEIAKGLLKRAIPELNYVGGHVFWNDTSTIAKDGNKQMGKTPAWYPKDSSDWRGRGVKDIDPGWYEDRYKEEPTKENLARYYGAFVLGVPLLNKDEEPGQLSWQLRDEVTKMHRDYKDGHILPSINKTEGVAQEKMIDFLEKQGVEFSTSNLSDSKSYAFLKRQRDKRPRF